VIGRLGTGGQGAALLARDLDLGRFVVLKRYHPSAGSPGGDGAVRDAQALSRLRSPYIPKCYGIERIGNELVLVMEYVPGRNLAEVLNSGRLDARATARLIEQVADGLTSSPSQSDRRGARKGPAIDPALQPDSGLGEFRRISSTSG
jgi:serine/threonine protein kinase